MSGRTKGSLCMVVLALILALFPGCSGTISNVDFSDLSELSKTESDAWSDTALMAAEEGVQIAPRRYRMDFTDEKTRRVRGSYSYVLPRMSAVDGDAAAKKTAELFNEGIETFFSEKSREWGENFEEPDSALMSDAPWVNEIRYAVNRTGDLLTVLYTEYTFTGGVHGFTVYETHFFSLSDSKFITPEDMTDDMDALTYAVAEDILRQIDDATPDDEMVYWENYHDIVREWTAHSCSICFNSDGKMTIVFPAYEIASYAAGAQFFSVDAEVYKPYLNEYGKQLLKL